MKKLVGLAFLASLLLALAAQSCAGVHHSGLVSNSPGAVLSGTTDLPLPSSVSTVKASGKVSLSSGQATVTFSPPSGNPKAWTFIHSGAAGSEEFPVGYEEAAVAGVYRLSIEGSSGAVGSYDLALDGD